jgi:hypothetical protein
MRDAALKQAYNNKGYTEKMRSSFHLVGVPMFRQFQGCYNPSDLESFNDANLALSPMQLLF